MSSGAISGRKEDEEKMENAFENQMKSFASELKDVVDENENGNLGNARE